MDCHCASYHWLSVAQILPSAKRSQKIPFYEGRDAFYATGGILSELQNAKEAWAAWFTGISFTNRELFGKTPSLKRVILLHPEGQFLTQFAATFLRDPSDVAKDIRITSKRARKSNVEVRWFDGALTNMLLVDPEQKGRVRIDSTIPLSGERPSYVVSQHDAADLYAELVKKYKELWEQSVPVEETSTESEELSVGESLEIDPDNKMFRWRVKNEASSKTTPKAWIKSLLSGNGVALVPQAVLPIELHWSHHEKGQYPTLDKGDDETVGVLMRIDNHLYITGMGVDYPIHSDGWETRAPLLLKLEARGAAEKRIGRWLGLLPDDASPLGYSSMEPAILKSLVNELQL